MVENIFEGLTPTSVVCITHKTETTEQTVIREFNSDNIIYCNMINANELRIGNWLAYNDGTFGKVFGIDTDDVGIIDEVSPTWESEINLRPIPLTEEILFKCGFVRHKTGIGGCDMWQGMDGWSLGDNGWLFRGDPKNGLKLVGYFNSNIQFLHQLQNLYFALCGEELNVEL